MPYFTKLHPVPGQLMSGLVKGLLRSDLNVSDIENLVGTKLVVKKMEVGCAKEPKELFGVVHSF